MMKRIFLALCVAAMVMPMLFGCSKSDEQKVVPVTVQAPSAKVQGASENSEIQLLAPANGAVLVQTPAEMREFLKLDADARKVYFNDKAKRAVLYTQHQSLPNTFRWNCPETMRKSVKLVFSNSEDFSTSAQELVVSLDTAKQEAQVSNFFSGQRVYWKVVATGADGKTFVSPTGMFETEALLPRQITLPGVDNVRDMGGWTTKSGKKMRQGMIFRSAGLNLDSPDWNWDVSKQIPPEKSRIGETVVKPEGIDYFVNSVGIRTDLDLRWDGEVAVMKSSPLGNAVRWVHISSQDYNGLFKPEGLKAARENFRLFADKANYPIDFHCIAGADRTGTLALILCGLVGVAPDDLRKDWEVTARDYFSYERFDSIAPGFDKYGEPGDPLDVKIEKFLLAIGVTQQEIDSYKSIILE